MKEKQKLICDTVLEMIASGMPEAEITIAEVARRSSMGKGTVYEYFSSKRDMFLFAAQYFAQNAIEDMKACYRGISFRKEFGELIQCTRIWMNRCRSLFFFLFLGRYIVPPGMERSSNGNSQEECLFQGIHGEAVALMAKFLSLGQKEGLLRRNLEFYEVTFACSSITSIINLVDTGNEELLHKEFTMEELEEKAYEIFLRLLG